MKIGSLVYNNYQGMLRFGKILSRRVDEEDGWAYYKVEWYCDDVYEMAMDLRKQLIDKDYTLEEYRKDQITSVSKDFLSKVLQEAS